MKFTLLTAIVIFAAAGSAVAQLPKNNGDPGVFCFESSGVEAALKTTGAYLPGAVIGIRADPLQMWAKTPASRNSRLCKTTVRDIPHSNWSWQIVERPANSTSQLVGKNESTVNLLLDRPGVYRIRFVACAFGCEITVPDYGTVSPDPKAAEVVVRVLAILPPDKSPVVPVYNPLDQTTWDFKPTDPTSFSIRCGLFEDYTSPAWYTVLPWHGASDYKLLDGKVVSSVVSSSDSFANHHDNDWDIGVEPHPRSNWLMGVGQTDIGVEWERKFFPERMRPTEGDWISAIGYWIYDCDHHNTTEIHPPVLLATQRARAIKLPESEGAGSNVYVPGIVTDIWVNERAGDITGACARTGLHDDSDRCLPDSNGSPNPIKRSYTFNIYLPHSPKALMAAIGKTAPTVPLFVDGCAPFTLGAQAVCEVATAGGVTYLKVTIDLTNSNDPTYDGRIRAAWKYAAPDNWGAKRWDVKITSLDVSDDGDTLSDGDWRFWVNTNNGENEWAKIFDCNGCVHGKETFDGIPWATSDSAIDHSLGNSIVLFPNQHIRLATTGFEAEVRDDSISSVSLSLDQVENYAGQVDADDGTGKYTMYFQVLAGPELGPAQLSPEALTRYNAYFLTGGILESAHGPFEGVFNAGFGSPPRRPPLTGVKENSEGIRIVMGFGVPELRLLFKRLKHEKRNLDGFFTDLKRVLQRPDDSDSKAQACEFLENLKLAISKSLWRKHGLDAAPCVVNK